MASRLHPRYRASMTTSGPEAPKAITRWLILVAADQRELYEHLREAFEGDALVEVTLERRKDPRRTAAWLLKELRARGVVIIPRRP